MTYLSVTERNGALSEWTSEIGATEQISDELDIASNERLLSESSSLVDATAIEDAKDSAITLREVGRVSTYAWKCTLMQRSLLYFCRSIW